MKDRAIDLALVVGLVLVAGAIVWTLFSLGGDRTGPPPDRGGDLVAPDDASGGGGIVPIAPDGSGDDAGGGAAGSDAGGADLGDATDPPDPGTPDPGTTDASDAAPGDAGDDAATGDDGPSAGPVPDRPDPTVPAADAPPVPESDPAELGRIGFSFVTGGAGACGIVLEPWTHVAVSRELLAAYGCGAEVTVTLDDPKDGRTSVAAIVGDTMNESFSRTVNVYVGQDEPALAYGLTSGTIAPR